MSFRLHRGPKLLTIFHDASSPSSQRVLSLLQARVRPSGQQDSVNEEDLKSPAEMYLRSASSQQAVPTAPFELEVVDKRGATSDQWNTIGAYLQKNKRSQVEQLKDEEGALVVDWDGQVLQSEEEVKSFLDRLTKQEETQKGSSCIII
ncbi:hypothetical protein CBS101457_001362 [Exobasidium rhododendri]|nr:hypothetical protein CBS101457_001362 [Exobasidium rhododendri]